MAATLTTIKLSQIADEVGDYVDQVRPLDPDDAGQPAIVEALPSGSLLIVDGFHRMAGMVKWCNRNGVDVADCQVQVVVCDDGDLIADAAEPGPRQQRAIDAIYEAAGVEC